MPAPRPRYARFVLVPVAAVLLVSSGLGLADTEKKGNGPKERDPFQTAKELLALGMSTQEVATASGLPETVVAALANLTAHF